MTQTQTMPATGNQSTPKPISPIEAFRREAFSMEAELSRALPPHIPKERFLRVVMTAVQTSMASNSTNLLECDRRSLWSAAMRAAQDGLVPDGREGAIVKYGDKAQWLPMVAGIRKKARNSGEISTWDVHCVHENDHFVLKLGDAPAIDHTYDLAKPRGKLIGAYSVALLKDGSKSYEVMSIDEIHAIRDRSIAWTAFKNGKIKSTPWGTDEAEMARKTVAKRHAKQLPSSADLDDLLRRDDDLYDFSREAEDAGDDGKVKKLPRRTGKAMLDDFATGKTIEAAAEPQTEEQVEPSAADAYREGQLARDQGKALASVPDVLRGNEAMTEAWQSGWRDRDAEIVADNKAVNG